MSKICLQVVAPLPRGLGAEDPQVWMLANKIAVLTKIFSAKYPRTTNGITADVHPHATIFPPTEAYQKVRINLKLTWFYLYGGEMGISDRYSESDAATLGYDQQLVDLKYAIDCADSCYVCATNTKPIIKSYHPVRGFNQDTLAALHAVGIENTTFDAPGFKAVVPTAYDLVEAGQQLLDGQNIVLQLNTDELPPPVTNINGNVIAQDYPLGMRAFLKSAVALGYDFKRVAEY